MSGTAEPQWVGGWMLRWVLGAEQAQGDPSPASCRLTHPEPPPSPPWHPGSAQGDSGVSGDHIAEGRGPRLTP